MTVNFILALVFGSLTVFIYLPALHSPFLFDDLPFIIYNPAIQNLGDWQAIYSFNPPRFVGTYAFALNYYFFKDDVLSYHVINLGIHLISTFLVWWLVKLTLKTPRMQNTMFPAPPPQHSLNLSGAAFLTAALFAVHPLQTMAVNHLTQRYTILGAMFYLLALTLYIKGRLQPIRPYFFLYAAIFAMAGLYTKQTTFTLPIMLVLYELFFFGWKKNQKFNWLYGLPFIFILLFLPMLYFINGASVLTASCPSQSHDLEIITVPAYVLTQLRVIPTYLKLFFWPAQLNFDYDFRLSTSLWEPLSTFWGGIFLISLLLFALKMAGKDKLLAFSMLWFFLTLSVESSFGVIPYVITEYRTYLPSIGLCLLAAYCLLRFLHSRFLRIMILVLIIASLSYLTLARNKIWGNEMALWEDTVKKSPGKSRPWVNLSGAHFVRGHFDATIYYAKKALELNPFELTALYNLSSAYSQKGEYSTALAYALRAFHLSPNSIREVELLGYLYLKSQNYPQALHYYQKLIEISPHKDKAILDYIKIILKFHKETLDTAAAREFSVFLKPFDLENDVNQLLDSVP